MRYRQVEPKGSGLANQESAKEDFLKASGRNSLPNCDHPTAACVEPVKRLAFTQP